MKKALIIMLVLLLPAVASADGTSWIKGGGTWGDLSGCDFTDGTKSCNDDVETDDEYFMQVSPINVRKKINKSKFGVRFEPWMGYSQKSAAFSSDRDNGTVDDPENPSINAQPRVQELGEILDADIVAGQQAGGTIVSLVEVPEGLDEDGRLRAPYTRVATPGEVATPGTLIIRDAVAGAGGDARDAVAGSSYVDAISAGQLSLPDLYSLNDMKFKNYELGINMFVDYTVIKNLEIYGGPIVGYEMSQVSYSQISNQDAFADPTNTEFIPGVLGVDEVVDANGVVTTPGVDRAVAQEAQTNPNLQNAVVNRERVATSKIDGGFFYGGEIGAEYKMFDVVALGGFVQWIQHDENIHGDLDLSIDNGTETRAGASLTYYW